MTLHSDAVDVAKGTVVVVLASLVLWIAGRWNARRERERLTAQKLDRLLEFVAGTEATATSPAVPALAQRLDHFAARLDRIEIYISRKEGETA